MATGMTDNPAVQAMVKLEKDEEERRRSISGMPTEAEVTKVEDALQRAFDAIEMITYHVEAIATSDDGADLKFQIGLDDLGILYVLSANIHSRLDELQREIGRIDRTAYSLDCIRQEQAARGKA